MSFEDLTYIYKHIDAFLERFCSLQKDQELNREELNFIHVINLLRTSHDYHQQLIIKDIITEACRQYWACLYSSEIDRDKLMTDSELVDKFYEWLDSYLKET